MNPLDSHHELGAGEPVVFVHGAGGDHQFWTAQIEALAGACRCISFDLAAHDDLRALVDELGLERTSVVAQSAGGIPAMALALRRPALVTRLVLIGSIGTVDLADLRLRIAAHRRGDDLWPRVANTLEPTDIARADNVERLAMPILLIVGAEDPLVPADVVVDLTTRLPNASCAVIPDVGHRPSAERPDLVSELLHSFLARSDGSS